MNIKSSVTVACFLPGLAKDLSAPLHSTSFFVISETSCTNVMDYGILESCPYLPRSELKTGSRIMNVITRVKIFP